MFYHSIDPVIASIGPLHVRWYGVIFVFGILLTYFLFKYLAKRRQLPLSAKDFDDYLLYGVVGAVVGARLGSVVSEFSFYASSPLEIFAIWNGGMAFHGGLLGLVIAGMLFSKKKKVPFYTVADLTVVPVALALAFGRVANFINAEFYGTPTGLPWGVKFPDVDGFRHPVQIYEAVKNFAVFAVLWMVRDRPFPKGALFWLFLALYSGLRFMTEFYKDLPSLFAGMTWGQLWSLPLFVLGAYMLYRLARKNITQAAA